MILPRQRWLAPVRLSMADAGPSVLDLASLQAQLVQYFAQDNMPLLVACLQPVGSDWLEARRGFVVPDDWQQRATDYQPEISAASSTTISTAISTASSAAMAVAATMAAEHPADSAATEPMRGQTGATE